MALALPLTTINEQVTNFTGSNSPGKVPNRLKIFQISFLVAKMQTALLMNR